MGFVRLRSTKQSKLGRQLHGESIQRLFMLVNNEDILQITNKQNLNNDSIKGDISQIL